MTLHGGAKLTSSKLREEYWVMGGNNRVKQQVRKCVKCQKIDGKKQYQLMGDLPAARVNEAKPFFHTGVDYTGFVDIKASKARGSRTLKGYVAVFICMVTKAVHLELVTELTSSAFLAALRRMAARKGAPKHLYSDQGTNFVGANNILKQQWNEIQNTFDDNFLANIAEMEIEWHFNAPSWPSAGGLWERAVRSLKHHLKRVVGEQKLTYEQYATILAQLEACLNSRPLCPLTDNIDDLNTLTPAHFLQGRAGVTIMETYEDARTKWNLTQKIFSDIWKRWKSEYLSLLTARQKWCDPQKNLEIGDIVVIHEDNLPAGKWALGRVIDVHAGQDGYVRVVTLKTEKGILKRPIVKLSVLPLEKPKPEKLPAEQNSLKQSKTKKPGKRGYMATMLMMLFYFLTILTAGNCVKMTPINEGQGLYFDKLGTMQLVRDEWKLVAYYDMSPFWEGVTAYKKYNEQLETICKQVRSLSHCDVILLQLRHSYDELQHYNKVLSRHQLKQQTRKRRGFINGVGNLANTLFGVLDDRFAQQYQKDISLIRTNEKHLVTMWKNQTSIVEAEYNMLLRTKDTIQKQHKLIHQHLLSLEKDTTAMEKEITAAESISQFTVVAMAANNLLSYLKTIQDTLLETITNIYNDKMNIHIISPEQLQKELNTISGQLLSDLTLPIDNTQTNLQNIYKLLKVKARMTDQYMIFEICIPLITRDRYDLYNIIPVPHSSNRNMISVIPIEKYVAMNLQKDAYMPLQERDFEVCIIRDTFTYMCPLKVPIYKMNTDQDLCIKDEKENLQCKTSIAACQNKWISLSKPNYYLYFCCDRCQFRTICTDRVTAQTLTRANIIYIEENCIVKTDNFAIHTHMNMQSKADLKYSIPTPEIDPINHIINITVEKFENSSLNFMERNEDKNIQERIKALKESLLPDENDYSIHDVHHYTAIYCLWITMIITAIVLICRKNRCQWRLLRAPATPTNPEDSAASDNIFERRRPIQPPPPPPRASASAASTPCSARRTSTGDICSDDKCSVSARYRAKSVSEGEINNARVKVLTCHTREMSQSTHMDRGSSPILRKISFNE
ncbi:uncharacterized protein LOC134805409 [Cydia splendana]|uniref:uncharacterized protein LOC134805409 n=1 Tax=Cydia splendana TaxID=1100963 RepID=UPI00300DA86C